MAHIYFVDLYRKWTSREPLYELSHYWFQLQDYTRFELRLQDGDDNMLDVKRLHEVRLWLQENCSGDIIISHSNRTDYRTGPILIYFQLKEDAILFKMVWNDFI